MISSKSICLTILNLAKVAQKIPKVQSINKVILKSQDSGCAS